jgi:hypothetical protein
MRLKVVCLLCAVFVLITTISIAEEQQFSALLLEAKDVDCKKCHADTPHIIHAKKAVDCVACHGDKLSVSIPQCTKCHDGPIHKVHAGKVSTEKCSYCHKDIDPVHNTLNNETVCSHCHSNLISVHGNDTSCQKCHKSPPAIVKPVALEGMVLICQDCHMNSSVATIHGDAEDKNACYECHRGTSKATGSEVPHLIHAKIVDCNGCHQENGQVIIPKCTKCHDIDKLHAFSSIGKLTSQSGLHCQACHAELSESRAAPPQPTMISTPSETVSAPVETVKTESIETPQGVATVKTPDFKALIAIGIILTGYMVRKRWH